MSPLITTDLLTERQIICQSANKTNLTIVKGQISAVSNIFFINLSCNIEVPLFGA